MKSKAQNKKDTVIDYATTVCMIIITVLMFRLMCNICVLNKNTNMMSYLLENLRVETNLNKKLNK